MNPEIDKYELGKFIADIKIDANNTDTEFLLVAGKYCSWLSKLFNLFRK